MTPRILIISSHLAKIDALLAPFVARGVELILVFDPAHGIELLETESFALVLHDEAIVLPSSAAKTYALADPLDDGVIIGACEEALKNFDISPLRPM